MFGGSGPRAKQPDNEYNEPLLSDSRDNQTLFDANDLDDGDEHNAWDASKPSVRFKDDVQIIAPPLRSTSSSREAAFELDDDALDGSDVSSFEVDVPRRGDQTMPLLVGLLDSSSAQRENGIPLVGSSSDRDGLDVDLEELSAKKDAGGSLLDSIANMANSILGAGIIGLPYAISQAGFFTGLVLLVVLCGITDWTIRLIVINAKLSGTHSYIDVMNHCFGPSGRAAVSFFQFIFAWGGMCAFGIIIGDTIPQVIRAAFPTLQTLPVLWLLTNRKAIILLCTLCVSYPLSLYRDIHKLARASGLALVGMLVIVASVLIEAPQVDDSLKGDPTKRWSFVQPGIFQAIGVISFAFVCHHNSLLIYGSLNTPTLDRFTTVTHVSTVLSLVSCCTLAVSSFMVFTDKTRGNILNNFAADNTLINIARFCFGLNMFTTLPLELFVCREVIEQFFFSHEAYNPQRHLFFTTTILLSSTLISLITCDLGVMLEITGGVSATTLAFIFPTACYLKLANKDKPWHSRERLPAILCAGFGAIVMVISLMIGLSKTWSSAGDAKICV